MKVVRIALVVAFVGAMSCMVSCKKETTPAAKIEKTTTTLENEAATLKKDAAKTTEAAKATDITKKVKDAQ